MSDLYNKRSISMSFNIKADEKAVDFFNRTIKEFKDFEKAINERMIQLFDENIGVGGEKADEAYKKVLKVFMLGYGHGWNDRKELIDKMKELSIEDKAKRYDEASKWMEGIYPTLTHEQQMEAEAFFPELKESEDCVVFKDFE